MNEPTISCPHCQREIKLTESLAAPVLATAKRDFEARLVQKDQEFGARETELKQRESALRLAAETQEKQVAEKLQAERARITAEEARKAQLRTSTDLAERDKAIAELKELMQVREGKLAEAQQAQAELLKKERALDDAKRELDLTVEKRIQAGLAVTRQAGPAGSGRRTQAQGGREGANDLRHAKDDRRTEASLRTRVPSSSKAKCRNSSSRVCSAPSFPATPSSRSPKANSAATRFSTSTGPSGNAAGRSSGNRSGPRTGARAGCLSSAPTSGRPKRRSPCW